MLIFADNITPRLQYILQLLLKDLLGIDFNITTNPELFKQATCPKINYSSSHISDDEFFIEAHDLLFQKDIQQQQINCFAFEDNQAFFPCAAKSDFAFDIFAASFFLISRYEEYYDYSPDIYGRYPAKESIAFKNNFLRLPIVNIWLQYFQLVLQKKFAQLKFNIPTFQFIPTYDIDIAYSFLHKGWLRTLGGYARDMIKLKRRDVMTRTKTLCHIQQDPYDCYDLLDELHERFSLKPVYFFLLGKHGKYDKNISPDKTALQKLIKDITSKYAVGIHPAYRSFLDQKKVEKEVEILANITQQKITKSRQHYIKMKLPETYQILTQLAIREDYSMGYGTYNGFRAGITSPFYWYDLQREKTTNLLIFPFCFMEVNSLYQAKKSAQEAFEEMLALWQEVKKVNGTFSCIWHNTYLGTDYRFTEWRKMYEQFLTTVTKK